MSSKHPMKNVHQTFYPRHTLYEKLYLTSYQTHIKPIHKFTWKYLQSHAFCTVNEYLSIRS